MEAAGQGCVPIPHDASGSPVGSALRFDRARRTSSMASKEFREGGVCSGGEQLSWNGPTGREAWRCRSARSSDRGCIWFYRGRTGKEGVGGYFLCGAICNLENVESAAADYRKRIPGGRVQLAEGSGRIRRAGVCARSAAT